jgi:hypothetical protein
MIGEAGGGMVNMGNVWDRTTAFLGEHLSAILPVVLLAIFVPSAVQASIAPLAAHSDTARLSVNGASLLLSILSLWGQLGIVAWAIDPAGGRGGATRVASRRLVPMIGVALLLLLGALLLIVPIPVVLALSGYDLQAAMNGQQSAVPPDAAGFVLLYGVALLIVFLFLGSRLALVTPLVVAERRGAGVFARSYALTRGIAWKIIGVLVLLLIVATVSVLAARTVFGSILQLIAGGDGDVTVATLLTAMIVSAVSTVFTVLACAFTAKLYLAARAARQTIVPPA